MRAGDDRNWRSDVHSSKRWNRQPAERIRKARRTAKTSRTPNSAWAGRLFRGRFQLEPLAVHDVQQSEITVPFPLASSPNTRHIADLKIARDGEVWISAASDPGDAGPFESAVYSAGRLAVTAGTVTFTQAAALTPLRTFSRKVEAIELSDDGGG